MLKNNISTIALIFGFAVIIKKITMLENKIKVIEKIETDKSCNKIIREIKYQYDEFNGKDLNETIEQKPPDTIKDKEAFEDQEIKKEIKEEIKEVFEDQEIKEKEKDSHYEHVLKDIVPITSQTRRSFWNIFM